MKTIIEFNKSTLRMLHDAVLGATFDSLDQEQLRELHAQIAAAWYGDCQVRQHCDKEEAAHPDWPTHLGMACQPCALETARQLVRGHEVDDMHRSHVEGLIDRHA